MGVIPCDRVGCDHVMCDYRILDERICEYCLDELRLFVVNKAKRVSEVEGLIRSFMASDKSDDAKVELNRAVAAKLESLIDDRRPKEYVDIEE